MCVAHFYSCWVCMWCGVIGIILNFNIPTFMAHLYDLLTLSMDHYIFISFAWLTSIAVWAYLALVEWIPETYNSEINHSILIWRQITSGFSMGSPNICLNARSLKCPSIFRVKDKGIMKFDLTFFSSSVAKFVKKGGVGNCTNDHGSLLHLI